MVVSSTGFLLKTYPSSHISDAIRSNNHLRCVAVEIQRWEGMGLKKSSVPFQSLPWYTAFYGYDQTHYVERFFVWPSQSKMEGR